MAANRHSLEDRKFIKMAHDAGIKFPTILPLFRSPPRKEAAEKWLAHCNQTPLLHQLAKKYVDNLNYITFESFLNQLKKTVADFNNQVTEPYVLWVTQNHRMITDSECSELWVAGLTFEYCNLRQPEAIVWTDDINEYLAEHSDINHVLILDDASYSGMHISEQVDFRCLLANDKCNYEKSDSDKKINQALCAKRHLYVGLPFLTRHARKRIAEGNPGFFANIHFLDRTYLTSIEEILSPDEINVLRNKINGGFNHATLSYFEHRFPDFYSTFQGFCGTSHFFDKIPAMRLMGYALISEEEIERNPSLTYLNEEEWKAKVNELYYAPMAIVPQVVPPYKIESKYTLERFSNVLNEGSHGEWIGNPIPERFEAAIKLLSAKGIKVKVVKSGAYSNDDFKQAIASYIAYKDAFFGIRWLQTSDASEQTLLRMKTAKSDQERFDIAKEFVTKNPENQLAINMVNSAASLKF